MNEDLRVAFIKAATWHGGLEEAERLLASDARLGACDIFTAAITGNVAAVRSLLEQDATNATATSAPYGTTALVYLCLSKYLRLDASRSDDLLAAARALLDAGANASEGFWQQNEFETALYGAAGVAHHGAMTKLLLQYGANPDDADACYHCPETHDNEALKTMVETGKISKQNLTLMLLRKHDWHDYEGVKYLLEYGVDPNASWGAGVYPIHQALRNSNSLSFFEILLAQGADPFVVRDGVTAMVRAAREGRSDVLELFVEKGYALTFTGVDEQIARCAMGEKPAAYIPELLAMGAQLLARFCLNCNPAGVRQLLALGIDVNTPYERGEPYFGIPAFSLPIHVAAWLHWPSVVQVLIEQGAAVNAVDGNGNTPLLLAIKACVDSYWTERRSTVVVKALLDAGASTEGVVLPTGYDEVDAMLRD